MAGGGGQSQTSNSMQFENSTTQRDPWRPAIPALGQSINSAVDAFWSGGGIGPGSNPWSAERDPWLQSGQQGMYDIAAVNQPIYAANPSMGALSDIGWGHGLHYAQRGALHNIAGIQNNLQDYASGAMIKENPYLDKVLGKAMGDATDRANAQFSAAGRYGSGAHSGTLGKELGGIEANARLNDYYQQQQNQLAANNTLLGISGQMNSIGQSGVQNLQGMGSALSNLYQSSQLAPQTIAELGQQRMGLRQQEIDAARQGPWANVANLSNIASQIGGMGGTSATQGMSMGQNTTRQSGGGSGIIGSILGGGMSGLSFLRNMGGLGGIGALFSDERLKEDVEMVGKTFDGQNIYSYRYKSGGPKVMGLMAQEVLQHKPHAVAQDPESGMLMVNYDEATS